MILAIAARISNNSNVAVGLVRLARVRPGLLLGTVGGVLIDLLRLVTLAAGWWARHSIGHAPGMQRAGTNPGPASAGAT